MSPDAAGATPEANPHHGPATDVIPLAEQFANHDEYRPDTTAALATRALSLHLDDGAVLEVRFETGDELRWSASPGAPWGASGDDRYEAIPLRPDLYEIVVARLDQRVSALVIADLASKRALVNLTRFVERERAIAEETTFIQAGIDGPIGAPFERTTELVGKRIHHRYSSTHAFEHIYLNPTTYCFQGISGPEAGVADVDRADTFKIADGLYLFSWHERSQPFNGAVVIDLQQGRSCGRFVGWDIHSQTVMQIRTGARSTLLNETSHTGL
jgi:hypothetical protein